jgi:MoxR-like ATPase
MSDAIIWFEPKQYSIPTAESEKSVVFGERGEGRIYRWDDKVVFAVKVAQATKRPLLLKGPAGSGKSSLAPFIAHTLKRPFYSFTVTARTQVRDMEWEFDALARLNDANVSHNDYAISVKVKQLHNYITPGVLWWAFDRDSAARRGAEPGQSLQVGAAKDPAGDHPNNSGGAVVLIDEIDKADPDVPNNLLDVLGSHQFVVQETKTIVTDKQQPLILVTTNDERELPDAFLRRCIVLQLEAKSEKELVEIANEHFPKRQDTLYADVAKRLVELREQAEQEDRRLPSTAEYLDAIVACLSLDVSPNATEEKIKTLWTYLVEVSLSKSPDDNAGVDS